MVESRSQTMDNATKPKVTSFFPLQKLKGTQQAVKTPAVHLAHLEEESTSEDPNGIDGVTEEFMVHLARAVKDAQMEEKCCYHCSSLEDFIHDCPLVKALGANLHLNCKEGTAPKKGAQAPQTKVATPKAPQEGAPKV